MANSRSPGSKCQDASSKLQAILVKIVPKSPNWQEFSVGLSLIPPGHKIYKNYLKKEANF
jgi:hypothetical protein